MKPRTIAAALALAVAVPAAASQNNLYSPTVGTVSGLQLTNTYNNALASLADCNSGATAPSNLQAGPVLGQCWLDTSTSPNPVRRYDGVSAWVIVGYVDPVNHQWIAPIGGGAGALTANTTTDLGSTPANIVTINGGTTIASFGGSALPNTIKLVKFTTALTLTNSASLVLPGGADIAASVGDYLTAAYLGSGAWAVTSYTRADGSAVKNPAVSVCTLQWFMGATLPANYVRGYGQALSRSSYPDYVACATRTQSGTHTAGNATITGLSDTTGMGAGMPVEGNKVGASCSIASVTATSITLNSSSCVASNGVASVTVFFTGYGAGGDSTKIGIPDCQGRTLAGRDNMSGTPAGRITGINAAALMAGGGAETLTLARSDLPNVVPTFTGTQGIVSVATTQGNILSGSGIFGGVGSSGGGGYAPGAMSSGNVGSTGYFTPQGTIQSLNGGVAQTSPSRLPPVLIAECIVRVLP